MTLSRSSSTRSTRSSIPWNKISLRVLPSCSSLRVKRSLIISTLRSTLALSATTLLSVRGSQTPFPSTALLAMSRRTSLIITSKLHKKTRISIKSTLIKSSVKCTKSQTLTRKILSLRRRTLSKKIVNTSLPISRTSAFSLGEKDMKSTTPNRISSLRNDRLNMITFFSTLISFVGNGTWLQKSLPLSTSWCNDGQLTSVLTSKTSISRGGWKEPRSSSSMPSSNISPQQLLKRSSTSFSESRKIIPWTFTT